MWKSRCRRFFDPKREIKEMIVKLAKFQSLGDYPLTLYYEPDMGGITDLVRVSEYVEINFPPRAPEEIVPAQIAIIEAKIAEVSEEFGQKLAALQNAKNNLLALTDDRVSA